MDKNTKLGHMTKVMQSAIEHARALPHEQYYVQGGGIRRHQKMERNQACPCESGKKYKKCCGRQFNLTNQAIRCLHYDMQELT